MTGENLAIAGLVEDTLRKFVVGINLEDVVDEFVIGFLELGIDGTIVGTDSLEEIFPVETTVGGNRCESGVL